MQSVVELRKAMERDWSGGVPYVSVANNMGRNCLRSSLAASSQDLNVSSLW